MARVSRIRLFQSRVNDPESHVRFQNRTPGQLSVLAERPEVVVPANRREQSLEYYQQSYTVCNIELKNWSTRPPHLNSHPGIHEEVRENQLSCSAAEYLLDRPCKSLAPVASSTSAEGRTLGRARRAGVCSNWGMRMEFARASQEYRAD